MNMSVSDLEIEIGERKGCNYSGANKGEKKTNKNKKGNFFANFWFEFVERSHLIILTKELR